MSQLEYERDQLYRHNKWGARVIYRGTDNDSAEIVKGLGFPGEEVLCRAIWPDQAQRVCDEHNDTLAKLLFKQPDLLAVQGINPRPI